MSRLTRADQKSGSYAFSSRCICKPGWEGSIWRSNTEVLTDFCSCVVRRVRLSAKVSARRKFMNEGKYREFILVYVFLINRGKLP